MIHSKLHMWNIILYWLSVLIHRTAYALSANGTFVIKVGVNYGISGSSRANVNTVNSLFLRAKQLNAIPYLIHPNATLKLIFKNHTNLRTNVINTVFELRDEKVLAVIGSARSPFTTLSSLILQTYRIPQCCGASTNPALTNKFQYSNFFRTIPNDNAQAVAMTQYLLLNDWKRVAIINANDEYGLNLANYFFTLARDNGIEILSSVSYTSTRGVDLENILYITEQGGARIVLFFGLPASLQAILQGARERNLFGPGYAWIASEANRLYPNWGNSTLYAGLIYFYPKEEQEGPVYDSFLKDWATDRLNTGFSLAGESHPIYPGAFSYFTISCLDMLIMGFDRLLKSNSSWTVQDLAESRLQSMMNVPSTFSNPNLDTVTGKVILDNNGDRLGDFIIYNVNASGGSEISGFLLANGSLSAISRVNYPGNVWTRPKDRLDPFDVAQIIEIDGIVYPLGVIGCILVLLAVAAVLFYRKTREMKQTSPILSAAMGMALLLSFVSLFFNTGTRTPTTCALDTILIPLSFTLFYGLLLAKSLRIKRFISGKPHGIGRGLTDWFVLQKGLLFSIPTVILLLVWNVRFPRHAIPVASFNQYYFGCSSTNSNAESIFKSILVSYCALLAFVNLMINFLSRLSPMQQMIFQALPGTLKESKMIGLCIYNMSVIGVFALVLLETSSLHFKAKVMLKSFVVFYVALFNLVVIIIIKLFIHQRKVPENNRSPKASDAKGTGSVTSAGRPESLIESSDKAAEDQLENIQSTSGKNRMKSSLVIIKERSGILGLIGRTRCVQMLAKSSDAVEIYQIANAEDVSSITRHSACVGITWNSKLIKNVQVSAIDDKRSISLSFDGIFKYDLMMPDKESFEDWLEYFTCWSCRNSSYASP
jgi:hypothetical protein